MTDHWRGIKSGDKVAKIAKSPRFCHVSSGIARFSRQDDATLQGTASIQPISDLSISGSEPILSPHRTLASVRPAAKLNERAMQRKSVGGRVTMMNWFRDSHGESHAGAGDVPVRIRIAFPSFGIGRSEPLEHAVVDMTVSREEIAALLKRELKQASA